MLISLSGFGRFSGPLDADKDGKGGRPILHTD